MANASKRVVVGYDTSEESVHAVEWAAVVAQRRQAPLVILSATGWTRPPAGMQGLSISGQSLAQRTAEVGIAIAREMAPDIDVEAVGVQNGAVEALESFSLEAQLIVLGHRGVGALKFAQMGSVAYAIANHAKCPVAIVRDKQGSLPTQDIPSVVGVDGSQHSTVALDQAAQWANETNSLLRIVNAWKTPLVLPWSSITVDEEHGVQQEARRKAEEAAQVVADRAEERILAAYPNLRVETVIGEGRPAEVIVGASQDASLVIVGARGRGDFTSLLLGSVSREVMEHARSAVYVVR